MYSKPVEELGNKVVFMEAEVCNKQRNPRYLPVDELYRK